jgi:hypothetical protein
MRSGCDDEKPSDLLQLLHQLKDEEEARRAAAIKLKDKLVTG